ncbi:MAG: cyclic nucleotide-binding domain-containing protein [Myxococcales bacterium]|nr:cyclic nucleotide-binding domain-containing protein [Myxococcales bacterium]
MSPSLESLDEAWTAWLEGRREAAIRRCVGMLEADPSHDYAAALLVQVLADTDPAVEELASELVDAFIDRGDLPRAVVMADVAEDGFDRIAAAFGAGSPRVSNVPLVPPPLPAKGAHDSAEKGEALSFRAFAALRARARTAGDRLVPRLPLFGALPPEELEPLLAAFEVRTVRAGDPVLVEGDEGTEAYVVVRGHLRAERGAKEPVVLAELGPGAIFGEMALVSGAPRAASVFAVDTVQLLVGSVKQLEALAARSPGIGAQLSAFCRERMIGNLLRHSPVLAAVAPEDRLSLVERFEPVAFEPGEHLVRRGEEVTALSLIASGHVRVLGLDADGDEVVVAELGPGDVFNEIGLLLRRPAGADVVATHRTVALRLTESELREAFREHPRLLGELYDLAAKRDEEMKTVVAQETLDVGDVVLL